MLQFLESVVFLVKNKKQKNNESFIQCGLGKEQQIEGFNDPKSFFFFSEMWVIGQIIFQFKNKIKSCLDMLCLHTWV